VVHERVEELPVVIEEGEAESVQVGAGFEVTVTVFEHCTVPPAPVAVKV